MTATAQLLVGENVLSTSDTVEFTATVLTVITSAVVANFGSSEASLSVKIGEDSADGSQVIVSQRIPPNETYLCPELLGQALPEGQKVYFSASSANSLSLRMSGVTYT